MLLAADLVAPQLCAERRVHLPGGAGEFNPHPAPGHSVHGKPLLPKPCGDLGHIVGGPGELLAKFLRREPVMIVRDTPGVLTIEQRLQLMLLIPRNARWILSVRRLAGPGGHVIQL